MVGEETAAQYKVLQPNQEGRVFSTTLAAAAIAGVYAAYVGYNRFGPHTTTLGRAAGALEGIIEGAIAVAATGAVVGGLNIAFLKERDIRAPTEHVSTTETPSVSTRFAMRSLAGSMIAGSGIGYAIANHLYPDPAANIDRFGGACIGATTGGLLLFPLLLYIGTVIARHKNAE